MILNILRLWIVPFFLCTSALAGHVHDHGDHGHDHGDETADSTEDVSALSHLQEELTELSVRYRSGELPLEEYLELREHIAEAATDALPELADREGLGLATTPLAVRGMERVGDYIRHMNPISLGRWGMTILRKYGPGAAAGYIVMEVSEQWAGYYALTGSIAWLQALAGAYNITHTGDVLFTLALFGTPYVVDRLSWARHFIRNFNGNPAAYSAQLRSLRQALPIDWSLNPYLDPTGEFVVLDEGSWRNPRTWLRRLTPNLRHALQRESFTTVALSDLERLARRHGMTLPPASMDFHARTELLVAGLKNTLEGTLDLDSLVIAARSRVLTAPAGVDAPSDLAVSAERLRVLLLAQVTGLEALDDELRHRPAHRLLAASVKSLRHIAHELQNPRLTDQGFRERSAEAASILKSFEEQPGLYRGDVTSNDVSRSFGWDLVSAKRSLQFFGWLHLAEAQEQARLDLTPQSFNSVRRLRLLERIGEAESFWQLAEALRLVADTWPTEYLSVLNGAKAAEQDQHEHGHGHGHTPCAAHLEPH